MRSGRALQCLLLANLGSQGHVAGTSAQPPAPDVIGKPGATPAADLDVTPDWEVPSMAAMVELHKAHLAG